MVYPPSEFWKQHPHLYTSDLIANDLASVIVFLRSSANGTIRRELIHHERGGKNQRESALA